MNGRDELLQAEEENEIDHEHHSGKFYFGGGFHKPVYALHQVLTLWAVVLRLKKLLQSLA